MGRPTTDRFDVLLELLARGVSVGEIHARTKIDPWFLAEFAELAKDRPIAIASPTDFMEVVRVAGVPGNFSKVKRGIFTTT